MIDKLGGRKFIFGIMLSLMGFAFAYMKFLTAQEWVTFEAIIGGTYVVGNVADTAVTRPVTQ